ncbi:asparaginase [Paenactinomyces guangxiensis]|uniref:asparaginase n=1 Tax=Paenactinomyces guangxiensis TaxID=1490290 RepID=A0A7W1WTD4_9BACL|nr:asparaginase [Paenactinomyces guangxiensis]MBA4495627.1 asparaginase [Paenactinomyces guangxiensis]MBH8592615.1 asparaginase [Paenactinomyces guangxiensis]
MKKIIVITTGGTIAMSENKDSQGVKPRDPKILESTLPMLSHYGDVHMEHLFNMPSPHITPHEMYRIAKEAQQYLDQPEVAGVVVTHGTDTLEETAYFLDLVINSKKPVVVTGAMRSLNELGADGPYNLVNAVRVAGDERAADFGTLVVFNDEIHPAKTVTKTHTSNVATFQSPALGPIGLITKKEIIFHRTLHREKLLPLHSPVHQVVLIKAAAGMDSSLIEWTIEKKVDGLVIEAFGQGNLPPAMLPGIQKALDRQIPIVLVSRCYNGVVQDTYEYEGGGKQLKEMGLIFSNGINGQKARIKLMLALQKSCDPRQLQSYFQI